MIRNILGSVVALAGAASAVLSPFRDWYGGRAGQDYRVADLFEGITPTESGVLVSILLPFLGAALLVVLGVVLRSRLVVALAGLVVLGFTILWMVRQGQAAGSLVAVASRAARAVAYLDHRGGAGDMVGWFLPDGTWGLSGKARSRFATCRCPGRRRGFLLSESAPTPLRGRFFACWQRKINLSRSCQNYGFDAPYKR
ncbi:hypothetical protein [Streptomyces parvus]|uniref:hypothetical protein n=1 Tax=Streptomyces parvus TaxID=66428 RepID=UPI0021CC9198|nr:hypothetical protein [Streptomyces parvus]